MQRAARLLAAIAFAACTGPAPGVPAASASAGAAPEFAWMSFEAAARQEYRLVFEGSTDGRSAIELRILDSSNAVVASALTARTQGAPLCPSPHGGPDVTYGPSRATVAVPADVL